MIRAPRPTSCPLTGQYPSQTMSSPTLGSSNRRLRVAVIGSGPSGFYAVGALFKVGDLNVRCDVFDRLPMPFGLVRGGVAPDHQKIKNVTRVYDKIAADERFRFAETPGRVPAGARISAGKSGNVARSFPIMAVVRVN